MKRIKSVCIFCSSLLLFCACTTAERATHSHTGTIAELVKKLEQQPANSETLTRLQEAYEQEVNELRTTAMTVLQKDSLPVNRVLRQLALCRELEKLTLLIRSSPVATKQLQTADYTDSVAWYSTLTANTFYDEALLLAANPESGQCREAARLLTMALQYTPGNERIQQKLTEISNVCTFYVHIVPEENPALSYFSGETGTFFSQLSASLAEMQTGAFTRFSLGNGEMNPEAAEQVKIKFGLIRIGDISKEKNTRDISAPITENNAGRRLNNPQPAAASGSFTNITSRMLSEASVELSVYDKNGQLLYTDVLAAQYEWSAESASYAGNGRLLSADERAQLRRSNATPPSKPEIAADLMRQLLQKTLAWMQDRYKSL